MAAEKYPFKAFIEEDKSRYPLASEKGYYDPYNHFRIGDSGGFIMNIKPGKFVNVHLLTEMADFFEANGNKYTNFKEDSIPYRQLRKREADRRKNGFSAPIWQNPDGSIEDVHISGDYYNFLNYTRMERTDDASINASGRIATGEKKFAFPRFVDAQFWTHAVYEFAKNNGFHLIIVKTRRGGFSYMNAARAANAINLRKHKVFINVAADNKYLIKKGGLTDFALNTLRFYEEKTMFKRGIYSSSAEDFRLGFRLPNGVESEDSWQSSLISVSANNNPDCAIGKDAVGINVEELSTMQNFNEFMTVTEPAMTVGDITTGFLVAWGTATATNMQVFEENFYAPGEFNFMHFENVWDKDARNEICGFFKSYCWGLEGSIDGIPAVDENGNSNLDIGLKVAMRARETMKAKTKTFAKFINYCGQRALFPAESFSSATENLFTSEELVNYEERLRTDSVYNFYVDGQFEEKGNSLIFKSNKRIKEENPDAVVYDWIQGVPRKGNEHPHGCIRIWFHPQYDIRYVDDREIKEIPEGTYAVTYDPVGINKDAKEITDKHSHNSIHVWEMPSARNGYKLKCCAAYYGRPNKLEEADRIFYQLCRYYNCVRTGIVEVNRGETVSNFNKWKATRYLAFEPLFVWDTTLKGAVSKSYGYNITDGQKKLDALRLFKEFLYTEIGKDEEGKPIYLFTRIPCYQDILELKKWNPVGNFDRVSEMLLIAIYSKSLDIKAQGENSNRKKLLESQDAAEKFWKRNWY